MQRIPTLLIAIIFSFAAFCGCSVNYPDGYIQVTHIIDARRGMPYTLEYDELSGKYINKPDAVISATIITSDSTRADAYATAVCVMGLEKGIAFLESKNLNAVLFTADKKMAIVGDVAFTDSQYDEYKDYDLVHGTPRVSTDDTISADYGNSYDDYRGNIFADTMEYRLTLMGKDTDSVKNTILSQWHAIEKSVGLNLSDSELSKFNAMDKDVTLEISEITYKILSEAFSIYRETEGAFNPAVVGLSRMWCVDIEGIKQYRPYPGSKSGSWNFPEKLPTQEETELEKTNCDMDDLNLWQSDGKYYVSKKNADLKLDMGGIAKGYAVDIARDICIENGIVSAIINIAGNMYLLNSKVDGKVLPWTVNVVSPTERNPFIRDNIVQMSFAGNVTIVTSGDYQRFYFYGYDK